jgi:hypothetical protein
MAHTPSTLRLANTSSTKRGRLLRCFIVFQYIGWRRRASSGWRLDEKPPGTPCWRVRITWGYVVELRENLTQFRVLVLSKEFLMIYIRYWCLWGRDVFLCEKAGLLLGFNPGCGMLRGSRSCTTPSIGECCRGRARELKVYCIREKAVNCLPLALCSNQDVLICSWDGLCRVLGA